MVTDWTCYDCSGRGGELVTFTLSVGGQAYQPEHCPICGQTHTVETVEDYTERYD